MTADLWEISILAFGVPREVAEGMMRQVADLVQQLPGGSNTMVLIRALPEQDDTT